MNTRCSSAGGLEPVVAPQVTSRPPRRSDLSDSPPACFADAVDDHIDPTVAHFQDRVRYPVPLMVAAAAGPPRGRAFELRAARRGDEAPPPGLFRRLQASDSAPPAD